MKLNKTFLTLGLAATLLQMPASSFAQNAGGSRQNPLLVKSSLPFGAPDFSKIQESDYLPAFEASHQGAACQHPEDCQQQEEANLPEHHPRFRRERHVARPCDQRLLRTHQRPQDSWHRRDSEEGDAFAHRPGQRDFIQPETLRTHQVRLRQRVQEAQGRGPAPHRESSTRVLFALAPCSLPEKMERMKQINTRISELQEQWDNLLPAATNNAVVWVNSKEELAGLSDADIAQCKKDAESRGGKAPYCIVIINTTQQPILTNLPEPRAPPQGVYGKHPPCRWHRS